MKALLLIFTACLAYLNPVVSEQQAEQAYREVQELLATKHDLLKARVVPRELFNVFYVDAEQISCTRPEPDADGCYIAYNNVSPDGHRSVTYVIKVAERCSDPMKTLKHEYCHAIMSFLEDPRWETLCHAHYE